MLNEDLKCLISQLAVAAAAWNEGAMRGKSAVAIARHLCRLANAAEVPAHGDVSVSPKDISEARKWVRLPPPEEAEPPHEESPATWILAAHTKYLAEVCHRGRKMDDTFRHDAWAILAELEYQAVQRLHDGCEWRSPSQIGPL